MLHRSKVANFIIYRKIRYFFLMTDNKIHPFAVFMAWVSQQHTVETVANWLDGKAENAELAKFYGWFSKGETQNIISAVQEQPQAPQTNTTSIAPVTVVQLQPAQETPKTLPKPESMQIIDNIQPADETHKDDWFPYKGIMTISTSDPQQTQFLTAEIRDAHDQLVEIAQIDPEFDHKHQVINLKIQTSFEDLTGQKLKRIVNWSDASGEEYSETTEFTCV